MSFELACGDSTFPLLSHSMALAVIADFGIEAVDICAFQNSNHLTHERVCISETVLLRDLFRRMVGAPA